MILAVFVNSCIYNVDLLAPLSAPIQGAFIGKRKALLKTNELREKRRKKIEENEVVAHLITE